MRGSRFGFLSNGLTRAVLSSWGKIPEDSDDVIRARTSSSIHSKFSLKNLVGIGSKGQVECLSFETIFLRRSRDGSEKEFILFDGGEYGIMLRFSGRDWAMLDLMVRILSWKNAANSSHLEGERRV